MKHGAFFITTARGGVHDEAALNDALASGPLGGAGVDVFLEEPPPPTHPLFRCDNVIATPHCAGITAETTLNIAIATAELWSALFAGESPRRVVNPEAWPLFAERFTSRFGFRPAEPS
jgi:D-3-phosphoglycerate dehydrogenase